MLARAKDMPPTLEQLSLALADSLDDRPLGMVTHYLTVRLLFGEPTPTMASPKDEGSRTGAAKFRSQPSYTPNQEIPFIPEADCSERSYISIQKDINRRRHIRRKKRSRSQSNLGNPLSQGQLASVFSLEEKNMGRIMQGHRAYVGHRKSIKPNKRAMLPLFEDSSISDAELWKPHQDATQQIPGSPSKD
ncbi:uncharacterized protein A4U43_C01F18840 [Asparagus officinalis]|uniref:Uncharacterized protein n=1 Tax=Asparagus officinalis TaxID=4686 RepID=A0A5P1FQP2_ASPOF|nr:uncharacterized protein A4U43_C01F18840 [Asparagus officinalis]